jgi:amidohydrolase
VSFLEEAYEINDKVVGLRRALHRRPEAGIKLPRTQDAILSALEGLPLEIATGRLTTSITAVLRGKNSSGRSVLLRAEMDALPVQEQVDLAIRSEIDGVMHACGHDLNAAMLVGAAHVLCRHRDTLPGDAVFMFQPGEETGEGAPAMIEEGVLDASGRRVEAAYALHVISGVVEREVFWTRAGVVLAAFGTLRVIVHGAGGHGSAPHLAKDPIQALAAMVTALQTMVTRSFDSFDPVVVTVGMIAAGTKSNVIPSDATFEATVRWFSEKSEERLRYLIPRVLEGVAAANDVETEYEFDTCPPTVNDAKETAFVSDTIEDLFGTTRHVPLENPLTGSEDFAYVLDKVPGSFVGLGASPRGIDISKVPFNHAPNVEFDEAVLPDGTALYAELAYRRLRR